MEILTKVNTTTTNSMVKVYTHGQVVPSMRGSSGLAQGGAREGGLGGQGGMSMRGGIGRIKRMDLESIVGAMELSMKGNSKMMLNMARV